MIFWLSLLLTAHLSFANNTIEDLEEASNVSLEASFSKIPLPHRVQKRFEHVQKLVFSGPTSTKVYLLKRNIEDDPSHIDSYLLLAKTFIDENMEFGKLPVESKVDRARDLITEGLKINPKSQSLWIMHANLQIRKDLVETNKALRIVHLLGEIKKLDDLLRLARTHNILKDRTKMEFYHNEAKKYLVTSIDKYKYHFQVALLSLDHKFAVDNYYEAEKYRPDYETNWIYVNIPHHLKQLNRFDEAIEMAKKGIKISQNAALVVLSSALLARGHDYVTKNNIEAGTADFLESFKYNKMSGGFSGLARIAAMRRDFVKAQELLIEGVPFHEGEIGEHYNSSMYMFKYAPKFRIAIAQLMYDQTKNPFWKIKAYKLQGEAYWDMGKQSQTFDHYNLGIKLGDTLVEEMKTDPTINFGMAYLYSSLALKSKSKMHIDESLKFFEQGIRVSKSEVDLSKIKKFTDKLILLKKEIDEKKYPENQLDLHLRAKS